MLRVLSLGAGVQSSGLYRMAYRGELGDDLPVAAIFADTMAEPAAVYRQLDLLEAEGGSIIPVIRVTAGDLAAHVLGLVGHAAGHLAQPPFHVINRAGREGLPPDSGGRLWRKCTQEYKLAPIRREVRRLMKEHRASHVEQWIGISLDEAHRMKPAGVRYITNRYPLIEMRMTRRDCVAYGRRNGDPDSPKSACWFCPYTSNGRWQQMRDGDPDSFGQALAFDAAIREGPLPGVTGQPYLHRRLLPLAEAVESTTDRDNIQLDLFGEECEGVCGV